MWFLSVKLTRRHRGCPLRLNQTNFSARGTSSQRTNIQSTSRHGRVNVNLISQNTCNINIHVSNGEHGSTVDSYLRSLQNRRAGRSRRSSCAVDCDFEESVPSGLTPSYDIFATSSSLHPHPTLNNERRPSTSSAASAAPPQVPCFGIPPPSFESVTSSRGFDPASFRQASVSSHSHSPPPSFENTYLYDALPSVDGSEATIFMEVATGLPDYESLHHGPPPNYDSIFPA